MPTALNLHIFVFVNIAIQRSSGSRGNGATTSARRAHLTTRAHCDVGVPRERPVIAELLANFTKEVAKKLPATRPEEVPPAIPQTSSEVLRGLPCPLHGPRSPKQAPKFSEVCLARYVARKSTYPGEPREL